MGNPLALVIVAVGVLLIVLGFKGHTGTLLAALQGHAGTPGTQGSTLS